MISALDIPKLIASFPLLAICVALVSAIAALALRETMRKNAPRIPWFKPAQAGTVYLFRSRQDPCLYKLGYTGRTAKIRQKELEAKLGSPLVLVATIRMPHAWSVEQQCHAALRSRGWAMPWHPVLGKEWYRIADGKSLQAALQIIERRSRRAESVARLKRSWHGGDQRIWKMHI